MSRLKKTCSIYLFLLIPFVFAHAQSPSVQVIPQPQEIHISPQGDFHVNNNTGVVYTSSQMQKPAGVLAAYLSNRLKISIEPGRKNTGTNQFVLKEDVKLGKEEYHVSVDKNAVVCEASTSVGMFYAVQTLLQCLNVSDDGFRIASTTIKDTPRYGWRGFMLDESRHFFGKEVVKQLLDVMAYLKMNRFHWHLTDEQAWRIEIKKYPKLTEIGAEGNWHDRNAPRAFYTQDDIREIVAYAAERYIMIIPEIDMPGHATAVTRAYPEFSAGGTGRWEGFTFHPAKETTYRFIDDVLTEIVQLFPAPYIHIGGDEVHFGNKIWFTDPVIQQFIKDNDLKNELGLEHYFIRRACDIVQSKGRTMIGWDEIIASGITPDKAIVMWWRHDKPDQLTAALEKGFNVIITPRIPCYFDFVQHSSHKIGRRWAGKFNALETVCQFPDNISDLISNYPDQVLGIQANLWTERVADVKRLYFLLFPRLAGTAESAWTNRSEKDYSRFEEKIKKFLEFLDGKGINYFNIFDPESTPEPWGPDKADVIAEG
ncbi:MAG: beta-N-acetylhexosaminidase [Dysgonamonadaceae bacterium]|nr:beta-N-acetylhexosaminidase [Dysgonamonadaceae bacterium]